MRRRTFARDLMGAAIMFIVLVIVVVATLFTVGPAVVVITYGQRIGHALLSHHVVGVVFAFVSVLLFLALFVLGLLAWISALVDAWSSAGALGSGDAEQAARRKVFKV